MSDEIDWGFSGSDNAKAEIRAAVGLAHDLALRQWPRCWALGIHNLESFHWCRGENHRGKTPTSLDQGRQQAAGSGKAQGTDGIQCGLVTAWDQSRGATSGTEPKQ
jgi:hypothetical protein